MKKLLIFLLLTVTVFAQYGQGYGTKSQFQQNNLGIFQRDTTTKVAIGLSGANIDTAHQLEVNMNIKGRLERNHYALRSKALSNTTANNSSYRMAGVLGESYVYDTDSSNLSYSVGVYGYSQNWGKGTVGAQMGLWSLSRLGRGNSTSLYGLRIDRLLQDTGKVDATYGIYIDSVSRSEYVVGQPFISWRKPITTEYGLFLQSRRTTAVSDAYQIWDNGGTNDKNRFASGQSNFLGYVNVGSESFTKQHKFTTVVTKTLDSTNLYGAFNFVNDAWNPTRTTQALATAKSSISGRFSYGGSPMLKLTDATGATNLGTDSTGNVITNNAYCIYVRNTSGGVISKGYIVSADTNTSEDLAHVKLNPISGDKPLGVAVADIANGAYGYIATNGMVDVYLEATLSTPVNYVVLTSDTNAGQGQTITNPGSTNHWQEIGHPLRARTGAGLTKAIIHFN